MNRSFLSYLVAIQGFAGLAMAQTVQLATVNGKVLTWQPDRTAAVARFRTEQSRPPSSAADELSVTVLLEASKCQVITAAIKSSANESAIRTFGVSVRPDEVQAARQELLKSGLAESTAKQIRESSQALVEGLHEVYDLGKNAADTYRSIVAPHGVPNTLWQAALEFGRTPEGRAKYVQQSSLTAESFRTASTKAETELLLSQRLAIAVDDQIARTDTAFRTYLEDARKKTVVVSPLKSYADGITAEQRRYLDSARYRWWQQRYAEVRVVLSDASLAERCNLGSLTH